MSSVSQMHGLAFLRPCAARGLLARPLPSPRSQAAYLSFYRTIQRAQPRQGQAKRGGAECGRQMRQMHETATRRREGAGTPSGTAQGPAKAARGPKGGATETESDRSIQARRVEALTAADALHYPRYQPRATRLSVPSFRETYEAPGVVGESPEPPETVAARPRVELSGRVVSVRRLSSKLLFCNIQNEGQTVQVQCSLAQLKTPRGDGGGEDAVEPAAFKQMARLLTRGDHVAVTGRATRASSGQLTLNADALPRVLSPTLAPLPTHLQDADTRAQRRHIDLLVNPAAAATLRLRSRLLHELRGFLEAARFVEVQTPILADLAGGATARPFKTTHDGAEGGGGDAGTSTGARALSLRIAPELWLKRLVVGGLERVYEIGPAFRNEGIDATHNPEFSMCEFYAAYWTLPRLMAETERLMARLARAAAEFKASPTGAGLAASQQGGSAELCAAGGPFKQLEFVPALEAALGFAFPDLDAADAYERLRALLAEHGHGTFVDRAASASGDLAKLLDRLAGDLLEPRSFAGADGPLYITHHPAVMSPLAKSFVCPATGQRVAARAELFVDGRELANMYEEENDPAAQRRKMAAQSAADASGEAAGVDENYIAALESGLPPTGGWGCGVERLVMLFAGAPRIADCLSFGTLRHVVAMRDK